MPSPHAAFRPSALPLVVIAVLAFQRPAPAADGRPNIIFIFTDDHASHAIGAYGSKVNVTPHLDRLAAEGMRFDNCFCTNSICGPSRAVILTGKHSHRNGFLTNMDRFDGTQQTFPKLLQRAGYETAMVGKWHLKSAPTGFDFWEVLRGQGPYYNPSVRTPDGMREHTGYTTDIITDIALDWLANKRDREKPFMLMYQHKAPHREWAPGPRYLRMYDDVTLPEPATLFDDYAGRTSATKTQTMTVAHHLTNRDLKFIPPDNLTEQQLTAWNAAYGPKNDAFKKAHLEGEDLVRWKYQRYMKDYLRCIAAVDDNVGRVLKYLDDNGLRGNTVVMYSSDQGFYLGDHGWFDKRWMYEESLRMPFIVRWPGVTQPGSVDRHLVQNLDFAQTFLDIAGVEAPEDMQGRSLVPLLKGERPADWRRSIYYHYYEFPGPHSVRRHYGVRTDRYKLIRYYNILEWELFDLEKDPDELSSVFADAAYSGVVLDLENELERLQEVYGDTEPETSTAELAQRQLRRRARAVGLERVLHLDQPGSGAPSELDPSAKPLTVGAWCTPRAADGVLIAQGGASLGYSLYLKDGVPRFAVRNAGALVEVEGREKLALGEPAHLAAVLDPLGRLRLYVNGTRVATAAGLLISDKPADSLSIGADTGSPVATAYSPPAAFQGELRDIRIYWGVLERRSLREWARQRPGAE